MTPDNPHSFDDGDDATAAPEHVKYPAVPLAYQTSPQFAQPQPEVPAQELPRAERDVPDEPWGLLDLVEPSETYGVDELMVLARDPWTIFCWWEATEASVAAARLQLGGGELVLRLHIGAPGIAPQVLDVDLGWNHGRRYLGAPRSGSWIVSAVGIRAADGRFVIIARAPRVAIPPGEPTEGPVEWMEVAPARSAGARREPPAIVQQGGAFEVQGAPVVGRVPIGAPMPTSPTASSPGASPTSPSRPAAAAPTSPTRGRP